MRGKSSRGHALACNGRGPGISSGDGIAKFWCKTGWRARRCRLRRHASRGRRSCRRDRGSAKQAWSGSRRRLSKSSGRIRGSGSFHPTARENARKQLTDRPRAVAGGAKGRSRIGSRCTQSPPRFRYFRRRLRSVAEIGIALGAALEQFGIRRNDRRRGNRSSGNRPNLWICGGNNRRRRRRNSAGGR